MISQPAYIVRGLAYIIVLVSAVSGCSTQQTVESRGVGDQAVVVALRQVGVPYRYGGTNPRGFDCSGLVQYSYSKAGVSVARTTAQLWATTRTVKPHNLRIGDLIFFKIDGKMSHVGMYIGGQRFVHAPSSGRTVTVASLNSSFYQAAFLRAGRP